MFGKKCWDHWEGRERSVVGLEEGLEALLEGLRDEVGVPGADGLLRFDLLARTTRCTLLSCVLVAAFNHPRVALLHRPHSTATRVFPSRHCLFGSRRPLRIAPPLLIDHLHSLLVSLGGPMQQKPPRVALLVAHHHHLLPIVPIAFIGVFR